MEPAPKGGPAATSYPLQAAPTGREDAVDEGETRPDGTTRPGEPVVYQPVPLGDNGATGRYPGSGVFADEGYPPSGPVGPGGPFAGPSEVAADGPFAANGPFTNGSTIGPFASNEAGGWRGTEPSFYPPPRDGPGVARPNGSSRAATDGACGGGQPAPPTGPPASYQPPPPGYPYAPDQPSPSNGATGASQTPPPPVAPYVARSRPAPAAQEARPPSLSLPPPPPGASSSSVLPPPPNGVLRMPPGPSSTAEQATTKSEWQAQNASVPAGIVPPGQFATAVSRTPEPQTHEPAVQQAPEEVRPRFAAGVRSAESLVPEPIVGVDEATELADAVGLGQALVENLRHVVLGTPGALTAVAVAALSGGHLLIEDVPGVGKTVLAQALAVSLGCDLSRLQGHPDLLPSDVTGVSVFSPETQAWEFKPGPVFAHVVLVDELNRTPPRTQAALLETMEEQQVSADGESWALPVPHLVIATQNPHSQLGTYPLVESQLDRFALATAIGYPDAEVETQIVLHRGGRTALPELRPVCNPQQWYQAQLATQKVAVEEAVASYAVALCRGSRAVAGVRLGASPRAAIWLVRTAQAHAVLAGRTYVIPGDIKAMALACLSHRLTTDEGVAYGVKVVRQLLDSVPAPRP